MSDEQETLEESARRLRSGDPELRKTVAEELRRFAAPKPAGRASLEPRKDWYIIRVELTSGRAEEFVPPPGRDFLLSPQHTFRQLAEAINAAFARWDLGHLYVFRLADGAMIGTPSEDLAYRDAGRVKIGRRAEDEVFEYEFDFGDSWEHRCTVQKTGVDPEDVYGVPPKGPVAIWGWGSIPDQYGRTKPEH